MPESLIRAMPPSSEVCCRTTSTPFSAVAACVEILIASETMTMTMTAATAITTTPMAIPITQPVDAAVSGVESSSSPSLTIANDPAVVHGRNRVGAWG